MVKQDTREMILTAGHSLIIEKSYNGCGLKEILDAAGVPKGSFYHYFKSKEDFGMALIERASDENSEFMRDIFRDRKFTPLARIKNFFARIQQFHDEEGIDCQCLIPKLALEQSKLSESMRGALKCSQDSMNAQLAQVINEAQAENELQSNINPQKMSGFLFSASHGASIQMQVEKSAQPYNDFVDIIFKHILTNN
ncbi:TetR/AcrR family transcriptional regulator [Pseudoalteromonas denitrificans]|jgi:TetR/AcrR family transcriptional repressor of nem operon|uniref:Transcriptional regulator, TetR family n=1 Tax=Pseudoalteromonas denitrificans DSM 6059 TaxID=1123010 RepID=A0A1I1EBR8_9GAMM|nr:TetR/AcrR family transcriptional regulator [Pseudoalteromonas denitrificans]SFB82420.1 transcriptional regulator, TetR family [Pseudoalteromonas denitrificans DSM 6059]